MDSQQDFYVKNVVLPISFLNNIGNKKGNCYVDNKQKLTKTLTIIGHDVWIGHSVTIMRKVKIGNGAVVAAKAVVTKDIPAYAIVGGNPAQIIGYRFEQKIRNELEKSQWWNWPITKIEKKLDFFEKNLTIETLKQFVQE